MTLQEQLNTHKLELLNNHSKQLELISRQNELNVIIKALELGVERETFLLDNLNSKPMTDKV